MRFSIKLAAAAAALTLSAVAQAATWTGTLPATAKITYFPNNSGAGLPALQVTGTGTSCTWPSAGTASMSAGTAAEADGVHALYQFLLQAKAGSWNISLDYTPGGFCSVNFWTRN